jgi:cystathionine beta-lyase/cystathionine gamma-synthase
MSPSSPSLKIVTPGDAGKRAAELAAAASRQSSSSSSMDTLLAHAGVSEDVVSLSSRRKQGHTNLSLAPSLEFATTYTRPPEGPYHEGDAIYTRIDNPTRRLLEETVGKLECQGASATAATSSTETKITTAFSSGMMAASSIVLAHSTPITVLLPRDLYHGVSTMMMDVFQERFGVAVHRVDLHTITTNEGHDNNRLTHQITSALEQQNYTGSVPCMDGNSLQSLLSCH